VVSVVAAVDVTSVAEVVVEVVTSVVTVAPDTAAADQTLAEDVIAMSVEDPAVADTEEDLMRNSNPQRKNEDPACELQC
jgi:hypothetical protein